jgi:hypothetical protein
VSALASSPFDTEGDDVGDVPLGDLPPLDTGGFDVPGFATPVPELSGSVPPGGLAEAASATDSEAIPAALLIAILLLSPLFGVASTRLADNVLAATSNSCPSGLDEPRPRPRP